MQVNRYRDYYPTRMEDFANCQPIKDLLRKQRRGEFLTAEEKKRILKEAEQNRISNLSQKKKKR